MKYSLKEVFESNDSSYLMGISYETYGADEDEDYKVKRKGWEIPYREADIVEIDAYASKYGIPGRRSEKAKGYWETEEPFKDGMTGEETYYILYVKGIDGSDISSEDFDKINEKLNDESDEYWGMSVTPRPLTLYENFENALDTQSFVSELESEYPVSLWMYHLRGTNGVRISSIKVNEENRGEGIGSEIMQKIVDWADENKVVLVLSPESEKGGPSKSKLIKWYRSFGFVPNKGRKKDFLYTDAMIRRPLGI